MTTVLPKDCCPACGQMIAARPFDFAGRIRDAGMVHKAGDLALDFRRLKAARGSAVIPLTPTHWKILAVLIERKGFVSVESLQDQAIGFNACYSRTVDTHVSEIRRRLGGCISRRYGLGFRWDPANEDPVAPRGRGKIKRKGGRK